MTTNTMRDPVEQLPDDLNPEIVRATAVFIGKITGLVPPPHNAFPPEWYGYLRDFTNRLGEIAAENVKPEQAAQSAAAAGGMTFQDRVRPWMLECFGAEIAADRMERNHRFFEEASELVQSCGMSASEAHQLVDYTWSRPVGEKNQEVGGVMVTLAALCLANGLDMHAAGETELARINRPDMVIRIRAKQAAKPKHSPLPTAPTPQAPDAVAGVAPPTVETLNPTMYARAAAVMGTCPDGPTDDALKRAIVAYLGGKPWPDYVASTPQAPDVAAEARGEPKSSCDPADICAGCRCKYNTYGDADPAQAEEFVAQADPEKFRMADPGGRPLDVKLERTLEQWAACSPAHMSEMSQAAIIYALQDAKHDILTLAARLRACGAPAQAEQHRAPFLPCPICNGVEGCDHTVPERRRAVAFSNDVRQVLIDLTNAYGILEDGPDDSDKAHAEHLLAKAIKGARAILANGTEQHRESLPSWFDAFLTNVCEIPDRNSPEGEPEAIVATLEELKSCAMNAIEAQGDQS
jgi:hypothetical protein